MTSRVEVQVALAEDTVRQLREVAQARGVTEATLSEQALDLLFEHEDTAPQTDYWLSVSSMQEDWDAMPDDWMADEVSDGVSPR